MGRLPANQLTARLLSQCPRAAVVFCAVIIALSTGPALLSARGHAATAPVDSQSEPALLAPGLMKLGNGATLYVPPALAARATPPPLLLLFPGTGAGGGGMIHALAGHADRGGFLLLAFTPRRENFDAVGYFFNDYETRRASATRPWPEPRFGPDRANIEATLARLLARTRIDCGRIGLLGFSHGASYALSLGTARPELFASIHALSPGIMAIERAAKGGQSVFLAHGMYDQTQPFARTANAMAPRLRSLGYRVQFSPFHGGHTIRRDTLAAAVAHFLAAPPPRKCNDECKCHMR